MKIDIKEFYKKETQEYKNYNIEIARCVVDKDVINSFINGNIVKFIFFDKQYADISSDDTINEIHKFKSKYRGNTYVRLPMSILKEEGYDYVRGIVIDENTNHIDGYVVVSKHDLYDNYKDMRYATKEKRVTYNNILNGNIFKIIITDTNKNEILCDKIVSGQLLVKELVNLDDNELQEIINKMINIADLEEHKEVDNVQEII